MQFVMSFVFVNLLYLSTILLEYQSFKKLTFHFKTKVGKHGFIWILPEYIQLDVNIAKLV